MEIKFIEKKKGVLELEFDNKTLPNALAGALTEDGVDAYFYTPHPLTNAHRLHIDADDPMEALKSALSKVENTWGEFGKLLKKELKAKK